MTLRQISEQTHISTRYLEAIEADDYKQLPGGIFTRSFIKAYARYVGFDEKEALAAYMRTAREKGELVDETPVISPQPRVYTDGTASRSPLITWGLMLLVAGIFLLGGYAFLHWYERRTQGSSADQTASARREEHPAKPDATSGTTVASAGQTGPAAPGLKVQIRAKAEPVWIRTRPDEGESTDTTLYPGQSIDITAAKSLVIQYAKAKAKALDVTINGRQAVVPAEAKGRNLAEMTITRDDYEKLLQ